MKLHLSFHLLDIEQCWVEYLYIYMWVTLKAPLLQGKVSFHNGLMGHQMSRGIYWAPTYSKVHFLHLEKNTNQFKEKGLYTVTWAKWKCDSSFALPLRSSVDSFPLWIIVLRISDAVGCVYGGISVCACLHACLRVQCLKLTRTWTSWCQSWFYFCT